MIEYEHIIREAEEEYTKLGMAHFEQWAEERPSTAKEGLCLRVLTEYLREHNSRASSKIYSFSKDLIKEVINKIGDWR